jgi:hypothetical protein
MAVLTRIAGAPQARDSGVYQAARCVLYRDKKALAGGCATGGRGPLNAEGPSQAPGRSGVRPGLGSAVVIGLWKGGGPA